MKHPAQQAAPAATHRAAKGRAALSNREGRFESLSREAEDDGWGEFELPAAPRRTTVHVDASRTVISRNESPDIPFNQSINPYRGCEHGCIYCYARPTHAYLGLSPGLDFETKLFAKPDAAQLLQAEINKPNYRCEAIAMGTNTDPYQPVERKYKITRSIIEVLARHRHPLTFTTKSALIERDIDLLAEMAADNLVTVYISITTMDNALARCMEPRAAAPQRRLKTVERLRAAGIPTGVLVAPVIPALNDSELEGDFGKSRGRRRAERGVYSAAPARRGERVVSGVARRDVSAQGRACDVAGARHARRARQRPELRRAHARARRSRAPD